MVSISHWLWSNSSGVLKIMEIPLRRMGVLRLRYGRHALSHLSAPVWLGLKSTKHAKCFTSEPAKPVVGFAGSALSPSGVTSTDESSAGSMVNSTAVHGSAVRAGLPVTSLLDLASRFTPEPLSPKLGFSGSSPRLADCARASKAHHEPCWLGVSRFTSEPANELGALAGHPAWDLPPSQQGQDLPLLARPRPRQDLRRPEQA